MNSDAHSDFLIQTLQDTLVLPVLVIETPEDALPLAEALLEGGCRSVEVTLRSTAALDAIERIAKQLPEVVVGAGTLTAPEHFRQAKDAGARYGISPGTTESLLDAADANDFPYIPAAATASEVLRLRERGYRLQKLFPASAAGGPALLKALHGPIPDVAFCPTGGISLDNMGDYLSLPNVKGVGGSWLAPKDLVQAKDWPAITARTKEARAKAQAVLAA